MYVAGKPNLPGKDKLAEPPCKTAVIKVKKGFEMNKISLTNNESNQIYPDNLSCFEKTPHEQQVFETMRNCVSLLRLLTVSAKDEPKIFESLGADGLFNQRKSDRILIDLFDCVDYCNSRLKAIHAEGGRDKRHIIAGQLVDTIQMALLLVVSQIKYHIEQKHVADKIIKANDDPHSQAEKLMSQDHARQNFNLKTWLNDLKSRSERSEFDGWREVCSLLLPRSYPL